MRFFQLFLKLRVLNTTFLQIMIFIDFYDCDRKSIMSILKVIITIIKKYRFDSI